MGFTLEKQMCLLALLVLLFPLLCTSHEQGSHDQGSPDQDPFTLSRATYYGSQDDYTSPRGACGFGEYARTVSNDNVAGVAGLYRNGAGCGACYQVRCTNKQYCRDDGVNIVVTDYGEGDRTDFILSQKAYENMASPNLASQLIAFGVVDVEYRRVSCNYPGYNLMYEVNEHSNYPHYLAIVLLYVAGQNDITAVEMWEENSKQWRAMRRAYGTVWDMANPPKGSIDLRLLVSGDEGANWVHNYNALPDYWKAGDVYDSNILFT